MIGDRTILLVHCGEPDVVAFCNKLRDRLRDLPSGFSVLQFDCSAHRVSEQRLDREPIRGVETYMRLFDIPVAKYDEDFARPNRIEKVRFPLTIFCVTPQGFGSRIFRNVFIHHTEASGLVPGIHAVPVLFNTTYEEQTEKMAEDDHLAHTLRRAYLVIKSSDISEIEQLTRTLLGELSIDYVIRRRQRRRELLSQSVYLASSIARLLSIGGIILAIPWLILALLAKRNDFAWDFGHVIHILSAYLAGYYMANVPPSAAFSRFKHLEFRYWKFAQQYFKPLFLPGSIFIVFSIIYLRSPYTKLAASIFVMGNALAIVEQHTRSDLFHLRIKLMGAENYAEHLAGLIFPLLSSYEHMSRFVPVLPKYPFTLPSRLSFDSASDWMCLWDLFAMRLMRVGRTFWRPRLRVFISYRWADDQDQRDADIATELANTLKGKEKHKREDTFMPASNTTKPWHAGIPHFLDKRMLRRGLAFRSRVAIEISDATHFILILSKRTVSGRTCIDEARHALACMPISMRPRILICLIDPEEEIISSSGDAVFAYLLKRADRIPLDILMDRPGLLKVLKRTRPECFFNDLASNLFLQARSQQ